MAARYCSLRWQLPLAGALLLQGCAGPPVAQPDNPPKATFFRAQREKLMKQTWIGHPYPELIQAFGKPGMIMNVPAYRPWKVSVVVYEGKDGATDCIDAFTVEHNGLPVVQDYVCQ